MKIHQSILLVILAVLCNSCGAYFNQPVTIQEARIGESTRITKSLKNLPLPEEKVVVGVYNFRDLTGQYKPSEVGSTFSTAVTQGATSILIKALEDSKWFIPIERANIGNLLNERNIIRSTRQEYSAGGAELLQLPPLLYAGILLEGGIVSYDTNIITGGFGARYFGAGGATQYRQDRVTVYLRAVSTSSGKILKTVYISKTILSQAIDASLFRYVSFQRLLEAETGFTRNEPVQLAVTAAIEKAVESMIIEGIDDNLWNAQEEELGFQLVQDYQKEKEEAIATKLHDRKFISGKNEASLGINFGASMLSGDYSNSSLGLMGRIEYTKPIFPSLSINLAGNFFQLNNGGSFEQQFAGIDLNGQFNVLPNDELSPYLYGGAGYIFATNSDAPEDIPNSYFKIQYGAGVEYMISGKTGLRIFAEHNLSLSDELDHVINGKRDDHYFNFGVGINFYLGASNTKKVNINR